MNRRSLITAALAAPLTSLLPASQLTEQVYWDSLECKIAQLENSVLLSKVHGSGYKEAFWGALPQEDHGIHIQVHELALVALMRGNGNEVGYRALWNHVLQHRQYLAPEQC